VRGEIDNFLLLFPFSASFSDFFLLSAIFFQGRQTSWRRGLYVDVNLYKVPEVKKSILQIGKIVRNSVYSGNSMNLSATFLCCRRDKSTLQR